jgi:hypothetical protein
MRRLGGIFVAFALGTSALAGCSQGSGAMAAIDVDAKSIEAHVTKLAGETLKGTTTTAADLEAVKKLLPAEVAMTWGSLTFDAATNSTLVTDLKLVPAEMPTVGVQIAELRLWDFDAKLLEDRISGKRLTETAKLARRIDAKNISVFGLAAAINQGTAGMQPAEPAVEEATPLKFQPTDPTDPNAPLPPVAVDPSVDPSLDPFSMDGMDMYAYAAPTIDRMDISLGRMIIDDVVLKPYQIVPAPAAAADPYDPMATFMPVLQQFTSVMQSYGVDTAAYFDYKIGFAMTDAGQQVTGDVTVKSMGARGLRGGDLDGMYLRDLDYALNGPTGPGSPPLDFKYKLSLMTLEDLRLEKVLGYLVKGVMPPRTETNLMGLGKWHSENETLAVAGQDIYTAGETNFDGTGFHWFVPTNLTANGKNLSLNLSAIMDVALKFAGSAPPSDDPFYAEETANSVAEIQQAKAMIEKNGLGKVTFDSNFGWNWNAQNGDTKLDIGLASKDLLDISARYEGGFPSFKAVSDLIPENGEPNEMALAQVFQSNSSLKLIDLNVKDNGGLTKIFGIMGDMSPSMGAPQALTAAEVRSQAVEGVKMMARPDVSGIPELAPLMAPVAEFLSTGGKLRIAVQPSKAMPFGTLVGTIMSAGMGSPAQAIKDLGLKVEHAK